MPIYEYRCHNCGQRVTIWRHLSDSPSPHCSICGDENLTRLISQVSIVQSEKNRVRDLSWVDKNLARRLRKKARGKLSPMFKEALDRMESE